MKRYLITGASRGIGRAIAEKLASPDNMLLLHGRNREALAKTCRLVQARSGKAIPLSYDLRRAARVEKMLDAVGPEPLATKLTAFACRQDSHSVLFETLMVNTGSE